MNMLAFWVSLVLLGVIGGFVVGTWYGIKETKREYEARIRVIRRYLTKDPYGRS